jgi:uncharacterized metal-binding protein
MPGGRVHTAITLATASGVLAPYLIVQLNGNPYLYVAGTLVGLMVTPDLDLNNGNISDTMLRRVFPPAQWIWRILWTPYSLLIPHRSPISHFPFVGTLFRIGYIFLLLNLFSLLFFLFGNIFDTVSLVWFWNWWFFLGLCHVDLLHYLADISIKSKEQFENE